MTKKSTREYLLDILNYLDKASAFTEAGRDRFYDDEMAQFAVIRVYEVIGEIAKRIPPDIHDLNTEINWRRLAGFRDFLAHNYDEIIIAFIWQAIQDLPNLKKAVEVLISRLPEERETT